MSCEHLICARCNGPVVEGRCPACRAAREELHHGHSPVSPFLLAAVLLLAAAVVAVRALAG